MDPEAQTALPPESNAASSSGGFLNLNSAIGPFKILALVIIGIGVFAFLLAVGLGAGISLGLRLKPCDGIAYEVIDSPVGTLDTPYSNFLIETVEQIVSEAKCKSLCDENNNCAFSVIFRGYRECQLFSSRAVYFLTPSSAGCLNRRSGSSQALYEFDTSSPLTQFLYHYWPVIDGNFLDIIGGADATCGASVTFGPDENSVANSAAIFNRDVCTVPADTYFDLPGYSISLKGKALEYDSFTNFVEFYYLYFDNVGDVTWYIVNYYTPDLDSTTVIITGSTAPWYRYGLVASTTGESIFTNGVFENSVLGNARISAVTKVNTFGANLGLMDEVRFYNTDLSNAQMSSDHAKTSFLSRIV